MTWNTLTNLSAGDTLTAGEMDKIRENIEHLGAMKFGETALSALATGTKAARIAVGSYTGNGAATQAITGVGFQPKFLLVYSTATTSPYSLWFKMTADGTKSKYLYPSGTYVDDVIISLDSDGFTVGDSTGIGGGLGNEVNTNAVTYRYLALG